MAQREKRKISRRRPKLIRDISSLWAAGWAGEWGIVEEASLRLGYPIRQRLLVDTANYKDEGAYVWFCKRWLGRLRPEWPEDLIGIRDELRTIWRKPDHPDYFSSQEILDKWLMWSPSAEHFGVYEKCKLLNRGSKDAKYYLPFHSSIIGGCLFPDAMSLRAMLIQGVFENWQHFKCCSNPDCSTPYFIAKRKDQTVCDAEICKAERQRQHALKWWRENRAKESKKEAVTQPTKKGSKQNVARKTR